MSFAKILKALQKYTRGITQKISIRWRLTILFVLVFGTTFFIFAAFIFNFLAATLQHEFDDALFNYAVDVHESITLDSRGDLSFSTPALDSKKLYPFAYGTALIQIRHINGEILTRIGDFGSLQVPYHKEIDTLNKGEEDYFRTISKLEGLPNKEAEEYRMVTFPIDNSPHPQLLLQVAVPMTLLEAQISSRKTVIEFAVPLSLLIAVLGGYFLSTRALRPVSVMISTAQAIGANQLSARLNVPAIKDELQGLAIAINSMLDRIEKSFASQERFIADASHQLLTPLTIIRGEIEGALRSNQNIDRSLLVSNLQEVEHLSQIVQQLLVLARVEAGGGALQLSALNLDEVTVEAVSRANRSAQKKNVKIQMNIDNQSGREQGFEVLGDPDLLQNLAYNLIENAVKYSPENNLVKVTVVWSSTEQILRVEDNGPGIPEDQMGLIFDRFHRAESTVEGHGLGLAIAKKIAEAHDGSLSVRNKSLNTQGNSALHGCIFEFRIKNI